MLYTNIRQVQYGYGKSDDILIETKVVNGVGTVFKIFPWSLNLFSVLEGQDDSLIVQGSSKIKRAKSTETFDDEERKRIQKVLNDHFCTLDFRVENQKVTCTATTKKYDVN